MTFEWWVAQQLVITTVLIAIVCCACKLIPNRPALQHVLWLVVLLKFLVPPGIVWPVSATDVSRRWLAAVPAPQSTSAPPQTLPPTHIPPVPHARSSNLFQNGDAESPVANQLAESPAAIENAPSRVSAPEPLSQTAPQRATIVEPADPTASAAIAQRETESPSWSAAIQASDVVASFWLLGALVVACQQLRRISAHSRLVRRAHVAPNYLTAEVARLALRMRVRAIPVRISDQAPTPFVWCLGRLRMIWPSALADEAGLARWQGIIAHELAHVRRRDHWIAWLELLAGVVWWWNPLFWFTRRRLRESAEIACDALAMEQLPEGRRGYAEAFLNLSLPSGGNEPVAALGVGSRDHTSFKRRLAMILSQRVVSSVSWPGLLATALLAMLSIPGWSLGQNETSPNEPKEQPATPAASAATQEAATPSVDPETSDNATPAGEPTTESQPTAPSKTTTSESPTIDPSSTTNSSTKVRRPRKSRLVMLVNSTSVHQFKEPILDATVDNPKIVAIERPSEHELRVLTKEVGTTQVQVRHDGDALDIVDIVVVADLSTYKATQAAIDRYTRSLGYFDGVREVETLREQFHSLQLLQSGLEGQRSDIGRQLEELAAQRGSVLAHAMGLKLVAFNPDDAGKLELAQFRGGLKVTQVLAKSPAAAAGIKTGDILVGLDRYEILNISNLDYALAKIGIEGDSVKALIRRNRETYSTTIQPWSKDGKESDSRELTREHEQKPIALEALTYGPPSGVSPRAAAPFGQVTSTPSTVAASAAPQAPVANTTVLPPSSPVVSSPPATTRTAAPRASQQAPESSPEIATHSGADSGAIDVTSLAIAVTEAGGDVELTKNEQLSLDEANSKAPGSVTRSALRAAEIKWQTARRKQALLMKIAQGAYDSANADYEAARTHLDRVNALAQAHAISAEQVGSAKRQVLTAEAKVKVLAAFPGIAAAE